MAVESSACLKLNIPTKYVPDFLFAFATIRKLNYRKKTQSRDLGPKLGSLDCFKLTVIYTVAKL